MAFIKKVCLLGDPAVGKTSLIQRFVYNKYDDKYLSTIGSKPSIKKMDHKGDEVTLTIWDIAGQETFQNVHGSYFSGAAGAVLVCDITQPATIENLVHWAHRFHSAAKDAPIILVSNKWDLVDDGDKRIREEKNIQLFRDTQECGYIRASVRKGENVESIFEMLLESMMG